ncbi:MAG: hypothetical protein HYV42_02425 [Candidatus Magasanikbacteria bacterium]|nr:hypothetical protein [Candidatus Magasanikbacteria bacterium]
MIKLPKFLLYGQDDPHVEESIQPMLALRQWRDLSDDEKRIAYQQIENNGWLNDYSSEILQTIEYLNSAFLRQCPGRHLHNIKPEHDYRGGYGNEHERKKAALLDFQHIFLQEKSDAMVFRMLSKFAGCYIDGFDYRRASEATDETERKKLIEGAFDKFDRLANCLNHIFEQFAVNQIVTRNGFVPRQDEKITAEIYEPTLHVLSDPKWKPVSNDLAKMFQDYREENYPEAITKAHGAVQRFLQILAGEEGKSGKGEVGRLFQEAKSKGLIPINRFTEPLVNVIQGFIVSERATNSTAKPTLKNATASDALLMMNIVMVFLQYCLQNLK